MNRTILQENFPEMKRLTQFSLVKKNPYLDTLWKKFKMSKVREHLKTCREEKKQINYKQRLRSPLTY